MDEEAKKIDEDLEVDTDPGDDVVFEDNTEVTGADYKQKTDKLRLRIKELEKKNQELLDSWQRDKADFINIRKRDEESKKEFLGFAKADIISEVIHGLKVINPVGEMYDHVRDEAIETVKVDSENEDGKILEVVAVGYELNGKEIRPPKVRIGQYNI